MEVRQVAHLVVKLVWQVKQLYWQLLHTLVAVMMIYPVSQSQVEVAVLSVLFRFGLQVRQVLEASQVMHRELQAEHVPPVLR